MYNKNYRLCLLIVLIVAMCGSICLAQSTTDYSNLDNWLIKDEFALHDVDVIFLLPTTYKPSTGERYASINDAGMRSRSERYFAGVAGIFEGCNVFVPHYRQVDALQIINQPLGKQDEVLRAAPLPDVLAALDYYFEHFNNGRPFILAGYSQGSYLLRYVLAGYMSDKPKIYERMVAAYLIGYGVDSDYLSVNKHLSFANNATDVGVIVSFNVEAPGLTVHNPLTMANTLSINPINWSRSSAYVGNKRSLGSMLTDSSGQQHKVEHLADAQVDKERGTVICTTVDIDRFSTKMLGGIFPRGIYHGQEYALYYFDLKANIKERIRAYFCKMSMSSAA